MQGSGNLYGTGNVAASFDMRGGDAVDERLTVTVPTPPEDDFSYKIQLQQNYTGAPRYPADEFDLAYQVGHVTLTIAKGAVTTDPLITLTLASAVGSSSAKPNWAAAATAEKAVAVTPVAGSETREAVVALSSADTATYA
ncbi:MAG: hypothetical protein OXC81_02715, partial [Betaproteobacteria bacterium]|nr:hypothetical protein [Betaproteobacteria bacterium]